MSLQSDTFVKMKAKQLWHGSGQDEDHIPTMASEALKDLLSVLTSSDLFPCLL